LVLNRIKPVTCTIEAIGSGAMLSHMVRYHREKGNLQMVKALRDRDMLATDFLIANKPKPWQTDGNDYGWSWERVEIENYLLDPLIVEAAAPTRLAGIVAYRDSLQDVATTLSNYAAARNAVARVREEMRTKLPALHFGDLCGRHRYRFPRGQCVDETRCRAFITEQATLMATRGQENAQLLHDLYDEVLPMFQPGNLAHNNYLTFFGGKDLLWGLEPHIGRFSTYGSVSEFIMAIAERIANEGTRDWSTLLPEWQELRRILM
jgi:hypothetical protein